MKKENNLHRLLAVLLTLMLVLSMSATAFAEGESGLTGTSEESEPPASEEIEGSIEQEETSESDIEDTDGGDGSAVQSEEEEPQTEAETYQSVSDI